MDLEDQGIIKKTVEEQLDRDTVIVVLGSPDEKSAELYAETVTTGDPTFAGPLAGVSLGLPVYHILEDEVKEHIDPEVYQQQIGMMEMVLDKEAITRVVKKIREG
jgi:glycine/sarcosine/betaine reductase complex component A